MNLPPDWEQVGKLGQGGTAAVYKVKQNNSGSFAAYKTALSEQIDTIDFSQLAYREQILLKDISFPGIVRLIPNQEILADGILLELCTGKTVENINRLTDFNKLFSLISAIAVSLEFVRAKGLIHADIKPDNIFLPLDWDSLSSDRLYFAKLSDFSLGRHINEPENARVGVGTVGYMAPEVLNENITSHSSDIFAFGVTAYQLLTGIHPFMHSETDPVKIQSIICEDTPTSIRDHNSSCPAELEQLVMSMMAKKPSERPSSAWEIAVTLSEIRSQYPYEKALSPKWFIDSSQSYKDNSAYLLDTSDKTMIVLDNITGEDIQTLRLMLTGNFILQNLKYSGQTKFNFTTNPVIPLKLRQLWIRNWTNYSFTQKKQYIRDAIEEKDTTIPNTSADFLLQCLRPSTIKRHAVITAHKYYQNELFEQAARLFIKAGDLTQAEQSAYQAATSLNKENKSTKAISLLRHVIRYAELVNDLYSVRSLMMLQGDIYKQIGETDKAENIYFQLIDIYKNQPEDMLLAETYKDLGDLYKVKQQFDKGIEVLHKAMAIYEHLDNRLEISHTYNNLGNMYVIASNLAAALSSYRKSLCIQRKLNATEDIASSLTNIGVAYVYMGKYKRAKRIMILAINIKKQTGNQMELARSLNNLSFLNFMMGENEESIKNIKEALDINRIIGSKKEILFNLENLTIFMIQSGKLQESSNYLKEGIQLSQSLNDQPHIAIFEANTAKILSRSGKIESALTHFDKAKHILCSINDDLFHTQLHAELIYLYGQLGEIEKTNNLFSLAVPVANKLGDKHPLLTLYLNYFLFNKDLRNNKTVESILTEPEYHREKTLFEILSFSQSDILEDIKIREYQDTFKEDIESPWVNYKISELIRERNPELAKQILYNTLNQATVKTQVFIHIDLLISLGDLLNREGNLEESYVTYQQALHLAKNISETIPEQTLLNAFQRSQRLSRLISSIKNFRQKMRV